MISAVCVCFKAKEKKRERKIGMFLYSACVRHYKMTALGSDKISFTCSEGDKYSKRRVESDNSEHVSDCRNKKQQACRHSSRTTDHTLPMP